MGNLQLKTYTYVVEGRDCALE